MLYKAQKSSNKAFFSEMDSFNLSVILRNNKLSITLKDFVDWVVYTGDFDKDSMGAGIGHYDVLVGLYRSQRSGSYQSRIINMFHYDFGKFAPSEKLPCFKIDKGGLLTINAIIPDNNTYSNQIIKQCKLTLHKSRDLSEIEIHYILETIQAGKQAYRLYVQVQNNQTILTTLYENVSFTKRLNENIKEQLRWFQQNYDTNLRLCHDIELKREQSRIKEGVDHIKNNMKNQKDIQLLQLMKENNETLAQIQNMIQNIEMKHGHMNLPQQNINCFRLQGKQVQFIGANEQRAQFIFNYPLAGVNSGDDEFCIKVTRSKKILIGVVDYMKRKNHRYSYDSNSVLCLNYDGTKYPQKVKQGKGIKIGDLVEVVVNRSKKTITYLINGVVSAKQTSNLLADGSRIFMPYVEFVQKDDMIEWMS